MDVQVDDPLGENDSEALFERHILHEICSALSYQIREESRHIGVVQEGKRSILFIQIKEVTAQPLDGFLAGLCDGSLLG